MIVKLMEDAKKISDSYSSDTKISAKEKEIGDAKSQMTSPALSLHEKMRRLCRLRQGKTGLRQKTVWALYEERHFARLIEDITMLVDSLLEIFPSAAETARSICDTEALELAADQGAVGPLKTAATGVDAELVDAIGRALQKQVSLISGHRGVQVSRYVDVRPASRRKRYHDSPWQSWAAGAESMGGGESLFQLK
jgi:hypothetical protein